MELTPEQIQEHKAFPSKYIWDMHITKFEEADVPILTQDIINHISLFLHKGSYKSFLLTCKSFYNTNSLHLIDKHASKMNTLFKFRYQHTPYYHENLPFEFAIANQMIDLRNHNIPLPYIFKHIKNTYANEKLFYSHLSYREDITPQIFFDHLDKPWQHDILGRRLVIQDNDVEQLSRYLGYLYLNPTLSIMCRLSLDRTFHPTPNVSYSEFKMYTGVYWNENEMWQCIDLSDDDVLEHLDLLNEYSFLKGTGPYWDSLKPSTKQAILKKKPGLIVTFMKLPYELLSSLSIPNNINPHVLCWASWYENHIPIMSIEMFKERYLYLVRDNKHLQASAHKALDWLYSKVMWSKKLTLTQSIRLLNELSVS